MKYMTKKSCSPEPFGARSIKGFTLIELLVVVLIIGILAAVALPQYQKAVDQSHLVSFFPTITNLLHAQEMYYLANGEYATKITDLDIDISHACPSLGGATGKNDLYNCKFGYKIINSSNYKSNGFVDLILCPVGSNITAGGSCTDQQPIMRGTFFFQHHSNNGAVECNYHGDRGKVLCEKLLSHFNT